MSYYAQPQYTPVMRSAYTPATQVMPMQLQPSTYTPGYAQGPIYASPQQPLTVYNSSPGYLPLQPQVIQPQVYYPEPHRGRSLYRSRSSSHHYGDRYSYAPKRHYYPETIVPQCADQLMTYGSDAYYGRKGRAPVIIEVPGRSKSRRRRSRSRSRSRFSLGGLGLGRRKSYSSIYAGGSASVIHV
ncbi:hypothetical protein DL96DRAFT_1194944 [Flagelloscypha sp. PMI_526]|nr:hypothetical protein DL96DRAFT_1194944 [Flagelloscypha sp. PMI_526]